MPDAALVTELLRTHPDWRVTFASYSTGGRTLQEGGWPVVDMKLPEAPDYVSVLEQSTAVIKTLCPSLVVSHEEFASVVSARLEGLPSLFIADWLPPNGSIAAHSLSMADGIIVMEKPGLFVAPSSLRRPPVYVGPVVRQMRYQLKDRSRARLELNIAEESFVISVIPGGWATETRAPIAEKVIGAFAAITHRAKRLLWLTREDEIAIKQFAIVPGIDVIPDCDCVERVMVASDMVITKGNRGTIMEAASIGIPSLSLSSRANPIDEVLVSQIRSNLALSAAAIDIDTLRSYIEPARVTEYAASCRPLGLHHGGVGRAVEVLAAEVARLLSTANNV